MSNHKQNNMTNENQRTDNNHINQTYNLQYS